MCIRDRGYHSRRIVIDEGKRIVDKPYIKKLAKIEGKFTQEMEREVEKRPWKYLMVDVVKRGDTLSTVYTRDILGISSIEKPEILTYGISLKEFMSCALGRKAQHILLYLQALY